MNLAYLTALNRSDISSWLLHLVKPGLDSFGQPTSSFEVLCNIVAEGVLRASKQPHILERDPAGAVCFYDVSPQHWKELVNTNPSRRTAHGIIVHKTALWHLGGRPAIYTDESSADGWPERHRYRLVHTDLSRQPAPIDWTHEREWRFRGDLRLREYPGAWCWLCVDTRETARECFRRFTGEFQVYAVAEARTFSRGEA